MMIAELARIASHLVALGSFAMDVGALTVFLWTLREREKILDIWDILCGARFTNSYTRIGGVANDAQPEALAKAKWFIDQFEPSLVDVENLLNTNRIFIERVDGVGAISKEDAIDLGFCGPNLRACGVEFDLRRNAPYLCYDDIDFKIPTYTEGDCLARLSCQGIFLQYFPFTLFKGWKINKYEVHLAVCLAVLPFLIHRNNEFCHIV